MPLIRIVYSSVVVDHVHKHALYSQFNATIICIWGPQKWPTFRGEKKNGVDTGTKFIECAASDRVKTLIIDSFL